MASTPPDLQALRAFVAVAREGKVSRAAERLHLSQPAVSLQLKALAESTGLTLFTRTPHGLALTADGAALLAQAEKALAALPWIATPPASAHHRLLASIYEPLGLHPRQVALVDQEASMLDLVRSGVGLSLVRDAIAMTEAQARGLVVADRVSLDCQLCFVSLRARRNEPVIASAWAALAQVWR